MCPHIAKVPQVLRRRLHIILDSIHPPHHAVQMPNPTKVTGRHSTVWAVLFFFWRRHFTYEMTHGGEGP